MFIFIFFRNIKKCCFLTVSDISDHLNLRNYYSISISADIFLGNNIIFSFYSLNESVMLLFNLFWNITNL
jgi:hypothetical protein